MPLPSDIATLPVAQCPAELPGFLKNKNFCEYRGFYHTDITIPSEYFRADVVRPDYIIPQMLDFTYLFRDHVNNPAYETMGKGRRIRSRPVGTRGPSKVERWEPEEVTAASANRLKAAFD
jgi:hypothetical protein